MMELKFEMKKEDYLAFNLYYVHQSATVKRSLLFQRFLGPIIFLSFALLFSWWTKESIAGILITFAVLSAVWILFYPKYFYGHIKRNVNKALNEGTNANLLGQHEFTFTEDGFIEKNRVGERHVNWSSIEKFEENDDYYFLYLSTMSAYILPKHSFRNKDQAEDFKQMLGGVIHR